MKINMYYGGRGMVDDPTLFVLNTMQEVLEELNITVERFDLHEIKNAITTLPQTLKSADGIILATTVEWYGIGGYMQMFLDACWLYGDKEKISKIYMCPIVMSTTHGEREGQIALLTAWEILGGLSCNGVCGYINEPHLLENNPEYRNVIEKKAENMYRSINQKIVNFPSSNQVATQMVSITKNIDLTPQETEQLSKYAADESYVQKQKEDIQELTSYFKGMLDSGSTDDSTQFIKDFETHFKPQPGAKVSYKFVLEEKKKPFIIKVNNAEVQCYYGNEEELDVEITVSSSIVEEIINARMTFQRAFMAGNMKMKGDFKILRMLDQLFVFG